MLGLGLINKPKIEAGNILRPVKDGLKLWMPYKDKGGEVQFVGTGSTSFDGSTDYIAVADSDSLSITGAISISLWVKVSSVDSNEDGLVVKANNGGDGYGIYIDQVDNKIKFFSEAYNNTADSAAISLNTWYHVVGTHESGDVDESKIYIDGVLAGTYTETDPMVADSEPLEFGRTFQDSGYDLNGSLKNVAIWNRALTATEVQNVMYKTYAEVSGRLASGLVSWWAMDATSLGSELATGSWSVNGTWSEDGGVLTGSGETNTANMNSILTLGKTYQVSFSTSVTSGTFKPFAGSGGTGTLVDSSGDYAQIITCVTNTHLFFDGVSSFTGTISNVSVKEIQVEDLKGSNDGTVYGATIDEDLYGSDTPVKPRAVDNAPTVQADAIGSGSASFNGSNDGDEIVCGNDSSLAIAGDMSVTAWINPTNVTDTAGLIVKRDGGGTNYQFDLNTARKIRIYTGGDTLTSSTAVTLGEWTHISCTVKSSTDELITNGDFASSLGAEWDLTEGGGGGSIALSSARLLITQGGSSVSMYASQDFTTVIGKRYLLSLDNVSATSDDWLRIVASTLVNGNGTVNGDSGNGTLTLGARNTINFFATATTTWITIIDGNEASATSLWDNVSVLEVGSKIYINGVLDDSVDALSLTSDDANLVLGHNEADGSNGHYGGYMSQVGLWQGILTQEKIQSVMEKDFEELTATEKSSLGAEIIGDGSFESGTDSWGTTDATITTSHTDITAQSGSKSLRITSGNESYDNAYKTFAVSNGQLYKVELYLYKASDSDGSFVWRVGTNADDSSVTGNIQINTFGSWVKSTRYFVGGGTTPLYLSVVPSNTTTSTDVAYVDNVSVKAVTHDLVSYWALDETIESSGSGASFVYDKVDTSLGSEEAVNGGFDDTSGWELQADGWTIANGVASGNGTVAKVLYDDVFTQDALYKVVYTVKNYSSGNVNISMSNGTETGTQRTANGTYTEYGYCTANSNMYFKSNSFVGDIDDISIKQVNGNAGQLI